MTFDRRTVDELTIADERSFRHIAIYADLKEVLRRASGPGAMPAVDALFLGEAVASAFDVYLVGRLLGRAQRSTFLETQVSAMAEAASAAGLSDREFERLLEDIAADPDRAFADLRELLMDATAALFGCEGSEEAFGALGALDGHRFSALLHHYELSNWVLYARAYGSPAADLRAHAIDVALRKESVPLDWLAENWIRPGIAPT